MSSDYSKPSPSPARLTSTASAHVASTAVAVTLTPERDPLDRRYLSLVSGQPCLVGRASKSEAKNLQAAQNNALFDCPVVSREHAELRAHPWAPSADRVTIMDKGSMHGTTVNHLRLDPGKPMSLKTGDIIQFGERVARGDGMSEHLANGLSWSSKTNQNDLDTHDGVIVRIEHGPEHTQISHTFATSQPKRGYRYPSDDDESDVGSLDGISIISSDDDDEQHSSSAQTTPESAKAKPGSQEQPIDVEAMRPPPARTTVIDLSESDPAPRDSLFNRAQMDAVSIVHDSVDLRNAASNRQATTLDRDHGPTSASTSDSWSASHAPPPADIPADQTNFVDGESDGEDSSYNHNTGLTGILNDGADTRSERDDDEANDRDDESDQEADYADYNAEGYFDADRVSDDGSEVNNYSASEASEDDDPEVQPSKKQPSPELGSDDYTPQSPVAIAPPRSSSYTASDYNRYGFDPKPVPHQNSRYSPIRGSQLPMPKFGDYSATLPKPVSSYTYMPPPPMPLMDHATDLSGSSRWDIPPAYHIPSMGSSSNTIPHWSAQDLNDRMYAPRSPPTAPAQPPRNQNLGFDFEAFHQSQPSRTAAPPASYHQTVPPTSWKPALAAFEPAAPPKNKISIDDIVEGAADGTVPVIAEMPKKSTPTGGKRKAVEISVDEEDVTGSGVGETFNEDMLIDYVNNVYDDHAAEQDIQEPPAQRRRLNAQAPRRAAAQAGKYALFGMGGAAIGTAGTMAFLCSPLAEKLLQWLS